MNPDRSMGSVIGWPELVRRRGPHSIARANRRMYCSRIGADRVMIQ